MEPGTQGLDWPYIVDAWAECALTPMGGAAVRALCALPDRAAVATAMDATTEWLVLQELGTHRTLGAVTDVRGPVARAEKGQVLDAAELIASGRSLRALSDLATALEGAAEAAPTLALWASDIVIDRIVVDEVSAAFDAAGQLSESRYPQLAELRRGIGQLHEQVRTTLDGLVRGETLGDELLQDRFWTVRDDRYVLPIKAHAKRWDLGIVHGTSGTGRTVFVEPHAVVQLNNQLRLAEGRLRAAEHAILGELSRELGTVATAVAIALPIAVRFDVTAARAGLARKLHATRPAVGDGGRMALTEARHPVLVLRGVPVVANNLAVGPDHPVLVLSGPNAGGKTVALKTLGLCAELVRHGCFVPAVEGSRVDRFDRVTASIGDHQTVEGDLSSFSAHLVALQAMVAEAGPGQLLLLDELASGTDPAQGAALAQAVCEHLAERGPRVVVTTHFAALKALGAADPRFSVAAVQYVAGRPTYRVIQGATGESHALDIAGRVGLPPDVLTRAEKVLGEQQAELSRLLIALEAERTRAQDASEALQRFEIEARDRAASLQRREERVQRRARQLEAEAASGFLARLGDAEKAVGQVVAELQRAPSHKGAEAARATIKAMSGLAPRAEATPAAPAEAQVGDTVRLGRSAGRVLSISGKHAQVQVGGITVRAKRSELTLTAAPPSEAPRVPRPSAASAPRVLHEAVRLPTNTADLRGMRLDESQEAAEAFFDKATLRGFDAVFLLHGHGTGALKDGLRRWLTSCPYVAKFSPAAEDQGGDAFTVVRLT